MSVCFFCITSAHFPLSPLSGGFHSLTLFVLMHHKDLMDLLWPEQDLSSTQWNFSAGIISQAQWRTHFSHAPFWAEATSFSCTMIIILRTFPQATDAPPSGRASVSVSVSSSVSVSGVYDFILPTFAAVNTFL